MKKITFLSCVLLSIFSIGSTAANNPNTKTEVSVPCYDSGLTFGLAGYAHPLPAINSGANKSAEYTDSTDYRNMKVDYR